MSSASPAPVEPSALPGTTDRGATARTERQLRMLEELAELGMKLARSVAQAALEEPDPPAPPQGDAGLQFCRYARAVRQTIALEARIAADSRQRNAPARPVRDRAGGAFTARRKTRIKRIIEASITADSDTGDKDGADSEALRLDLAERLDDPEFGAEFANQSIGEIVATICQDLGVPFDCSQWTDEELGEADPGEAPECDGAPAPFPPENPARRHLWWPGRHAVTVQEIDPFPD